MTAKRFLIFVCACSMAMLLWPSDALAQRGGGGGGHGGSGGHGGGGRPAPNGGGPSGGHGGYPSGHPGGGGYGGGYRGGYYYRPAYYYRPYYYRPYYSPYFYNGFYTSFYFGLGWYPYYGSFGWGYPYYGNYAYYGSPYYSGYGYQYGPYPYPAYAYAPWSSARIEVKPRDAQVYVDGNFAGVVDSFDGVFQRLDVTAGEHEIEIYSPGYHTYTERTLFSPGQSYHFKTDLQPLPPGAPPEPKPQPQPRASGNGYDPNQQGYDPNQQGRDPYGSPEPYGRQPPPPPYGRTLPPPESPDRNRVEVGGGFATLSLRVQPGDATVQIDGERWDSPEGGSRLIVQLAVGQHRIEVRKDGFRPYSTTITIRPGEPQSLNVVLPPAQEASLRGQ